MSILSQIKENSLPNSTDDSDDDYEFQTESVSTDNKRSLTLKTLETIDKILEHDLKLPKDVRVQNELNSKMLKFQNEHLENDINEILTRKILETNLSTNFNALLRSEANFFQKDKTIIISEQTLIDECLMFLSGIKSSLIFQINQNGEFKLNKKFQLTNLYGELEDCLKCIGVYSKIVFNCNEFVNRCIKDSSFSTQVYEAFSQCLVEYLRFYKENLNLIGKILVKKEIKFTLIDFLNRIRDPFFLHLDFFNLFMKVIEQDVNKSANEKSVNLILAVHKCLIDSYSSYNHPKLETKMLAWLFIRLMSPLLNFVDKFIEEGILHDYKFELGFKRNSNILIDNVEYWRAGYVESSSSNQPLSQEYLQKLPAFMRVLLTSAFNICKHMEIVKLVGRFSEMSDVNQKFLATMKSYCPYLADLEQSLQETDLNPGQKNSKQSLLEINFNELKSLSETKFNFELNKSQVATIESIFRTHYETSRLEKSTTETFALFNLEKVIEEAISDSLQKYVNYCSNILIEKLFEKYHMHKFFEFLHSYYLFKSNEIMFVFSKRLFDTIISYETYQEDAILNNIFYNSSTSVFTTTALIQKNPFSSNIVTLHYDKQAESSQQVTSNASSRLISLVKLRVKVAWPLNITIKNSNIDSYNRIFAFILQLKQVKYDLDSLDLKDMDVKKNAISNTKRSNRMEVDEAENKEIKFDLASINKMLLLRFKLMNFMNTAHDLILNQIYEINDEFLKKLKSKNDIDEIIELHEKFILRILNICLLQNKQFQQSFNKIFNSILEYCDMWRRGIHYFTKTKRETVLELENNINVYFEFIHKLISSILNKNKSTHLIPLIVVLEQN